MEATSRRWPQPASSLAPSFLSLGACSTRRSGSRRSRSLVQRPRSWMKQRGFDMLQTPRHTNLPTTAWRSSKPPLCLTSRRSLVRWWWTLARETGDKLAEAVTNLLRDCTGVTQVFIVNLRNPGTSTNALLNAFTMHGQRIRQLKMLACASLHHTSEAPPLYSAFESLEELTVHVSLFQASEEEPLAVVVPQSLRRYHQISSIMNIPLPNLLQYSFKTLQHLELDPTSDSDDDFQLSRFKKLETLHYRIAQPSLEQAEILLDTIDSARKLKTLQSIELSVHCGRGFEDDSGEDKKAFLDCLTNDRFLCRLPHRLPPYASAAPTFLSKPSSPGSRTSRSNPPFVNSALPHPIGCV
ncbi:hypothetical protein BCR35DRAFT_136044 [Leucosporidium creatinivorum]|uniref:Uncharacterized protein n=1 Tax=Leucosporidium creatinivorum TaxID=106004 RepID=A0A1Y2G0T5_9BASI|nr:hypothetical protein BCR35DRAFT_136044 [Leucosporidium creatinivorum]